MAHFLEADLRPWACALAAALFAPHAVQPSTVMPQRKARGLASRDVSEAPGRSGSASAAMLVSSKAHRESAWRRLEELRPLDGAVDAVFRASRLPLAEQLPRTPAEWQPAAISSRAVDGALELSYREAAVCCIAMHAVRGVHSLTLALHGASRIAMQADTGERACAALASLSTLRTLKLGTDGLLDDTFPGALAPGLPRLAQLKAFEVHWGNHDPAALARPLGRLTTLTRLDVSIDPGIQAQDAITSRLTCLSRLVALSVSGLGAADLVPPLTTLTKLTSLSFGVGTADTDTLTAALTHLPQLARLCLLASNLRVDGVDALTPASGSLSRLVHLHLDWCGLGTHGATALARLLGTLSTLTFLKISNDDFGVAGAEALAPALGRLSRLAHLRFSGNALGAAGAGALAPALGRLTALTFLDLRNNKIGHDGMQRLAPALAHLTGLRDLRLGANGMHDSAVDALRARLPATVWEASDLHRWRSRIAGS